MTRGLRVRAAWAALMVLPACGHAPVVTAPEAAGPTGPPTPSCLELMPPEGRRCAEAGDEAASCTVLHAPEQLATTWVSVARIALPSCSSVEEERLVLARSSGGKWQTLAALGSVFHGAGQGGTIALTAVHALASDAIAVAQRQESVLQDECRETVVRLETLFVCDDLDEPDLWSCGVVPLSSHSSCTLHSAKAECVDACEAGVDEDYSARYRIEGDDIVIESDGDYLPRLSSLLGRGSPADVIQRVIELTTGPEP